MLDLSRPAWFAAWYVLASLLVGLLVITLRLFVLDDRSSAILAGVLFVTGGGDLAVLGGLSPAVAPKVTAGAILTGLVLVAIGVLVIANTLKSSPPE